MNGAITPHVLACEEGLSNNFNRAGGGGEKGGSFSGIAIAECPGARVGPALGWSTNIEVANEEPCALGMCRSQKCGGAESPPELLLGTFRLVIQGDYCTAAIEMPNSHKKVTSREKCFVLNSIFLDRGYQNEPG